MKPDIYFIESIGSGSLSMMAKPVSGEWIDDEFDKIAADGIKTIVSLLERTEAYDVGLQDEEIISNKHGMTFHSFPIKDRGIPQSKEEFRAFSKSLYSFAAGGESVVVHCRAGIGRASLMAAGVLLHCGFEVADAFQHIASKRGVSVPDTDEQVDWLIENKAFILAGWS